jgi:cystathionine gamma-synthase
VTGGIVIAREQNALFERIRLVQGAGGAVPSPFDCWLVLRGLRTLPVRMRAQSENALRVTTFLASQANVERVHYPGLTSAADHALAARQMTAFGGMLSFEVKGGAAAAIAVAAKVRIFIRATILGSVESLVEHRASVAGEDPRTPQGLLRLSIGLEHADDLIEDLAQALA